jgi:hypothetical protein
MRPTEERAQWLSDVNPRLPAVNQLEAGVPTWDAMQVSGVRML